MAKDASGGAGEPMEDVIRSMKLSARAKVGEKPQPSARVATFKSRGSEENVRKTPILHFGFVNCYDECWCVRGCEFVYA